MNANETDPRGPLEKTKDELRMAEYRLRVANIRVHNAKAQRDIEIRAVEELKEELTALRGR